MQIKAFILLVVHFSLGIYSYSSAFGQSVLPAAYDTESYIPLLTGHRVAIVANPTSTIGTTHLVDSLLALNIDVIKVFAPEHGFRGTADAGEKIVNGKDPRTGLPITSLYGKRKEPSREDLQDVDLVIFDIQDVGVRYYTYISTMHYVMQACARNGKQLLVLDRPNPNGHYIDGPVLDMKYQSFVGMHPIPLVHGLTVGELAQMINGEGWLEDQMKCDLTVIKCTNYDHQTPYSLPIKPSPNLPNDASIYLYPSLGLFEGTVISVARGTAFPFQAIGHPQMKNTSFSFTPQSVTGAKNPPFKGVKVYGFDLREFGAEKGWNLQQVYLNWVITAYEQTEIDEPFFLKSGFFNLLAGTDQLQQQIEDGLDANQIRASWKEDLDEYRLLRAKYLLYP